MPAFHPLTHWWVRGIAGGIRNLKQIQASGVRLSDQDALDLVFMAKRLNEMVAYHLGQTVEFTNPPRSYL